MLVSRKSRAAGFLVYALHFALLAFAVYGFAVSGRARSIYMPLTVLFIYYTIMHNIFPPIARYRLPIEPYIVMFSVYGAYSIFNSIKSGRITKNV